MQVKQGDSSMSRRETPAAPMSKVLPTDSFSVTFAGLIGRPGGAHTQPAALKVSDFYGNTTDYIVQTVKWEEGETVFLTIVEGDGRARKVMLPPKVLATIERQRVSVQTQVRRRHGKRLAEERKAAGIEPFVKRA